MSKIVFQCSSDISQTQTVNIKYLNSCLMSILNIEIGGMLSPEHSCRIHFAEIATGINVLNTSIHNNTNTIIMIWQQFNMCEFFMLHLLR